MLDQLLRPKVAFLVGIGLLLVGFLFEVAVYPAAIYAAQSIGYPLASDFAQGLVQIVSTVSWIIRFVAPALIAASLVLLKLDRLSAAGTFRPTQTGATHDEARD